MKLVGERMTLAATDLARFLACPHSSALDLAVAQGRRPKPRHRSDPALAQQCSGEVAFTVNGLIDLLLANLPAETACSSGTRRPMNLCGR